MSLQAEIEPTPSKKPQLGKQKGKNRKDFALKLA